MKYFFWSFLALMGLAFVACSETDAVDEYDNWQERNEHYIDSIATVARSNQGESVGQWKIWKDYKKNPDSSLSVGNDGTQNYVYAKVLSLGQATDCPIFTDSVKVYYRGRLIPTARNNDGWVFDQSYYGDLTEESLAWQPTTNFMTSNLITGWITALMKMHKGDRYLLYIPQKLGYGTNGSSSIPGHSTLVFDVYLKDFGF